MRHLAVGGRSMRTDDCDERQVAAPRGDAKILEQNYAAYKLLYNALKPVANIVNNLDSCKR